MLFFAAGGVFSFWSVIVIGGQCNLCLRHSLVLCHFG